MNAVAATAAVIENANTERTRRDELVIEHLPLVSAIAAHVQRSLPVHTELDDLVHAGMLGLIDAATKYRADKNVAFATYAKHRIRGAILDSLRQLDCASRDLRKRYKQMEAVTRELAAKLHRTPAQSEIAEAMGLSQSRWKALMLNFRSLGLIAAAQLASNDREDHPANDTPCAAADVPDQIFARREMGARLDAALQTLPERYQQVVKLYYERDLSMKEIGSLLGVNESRISQIHKAALEKMQAVLADTGIHSAAAFDIPRPPQPASARSSTVSAGR